MDRNEKRNPPLVAGGQGREAVDVEWSAWVCGVCIVAAAAILCLAAILAL